MSIAQPLSQSNQTNPIRSSCDDALTRINERLIAIQNNALLRYEFRLIVQTRDISHQLFKSMNSPLLPLACDNICIDKGYYKIARSMVDIDEKTIHIWLAPIVVHRLNSVRELEAFEQVVKEHKGEGWHD